MAAVPGVHQRQESSNSPTGGLLTIPPPLTNHYPYKPLDAGRNEIRLLRVHEPFEADGLVSCTIGHVSLDLNPTYEALSYTWSDRTGNAQLDKKVLLDGQLVAITRNLEAALRNILVSDQHKILWIDALCIDQGNVAERNEQVSKMKLVYQQAAAVIAWLGEEYDDSREAFKLLRSFRELGLPKTIYNKPEPWTRETVLPNDIVQKTHSLIRLFRREYWMRAWVVQEIAFAQKLFLYCGSDNISWEDMKRACDAVYIDANWLGEAFYGSSIGHITWHLISSGPNTIEPFNSRMKKEYIKPRDSQVAPLSDKQDVTLSKLLMRHRIKRATDPRDKIYSLLSLIPIEEQNRIRIDYNLDASQVFRNVAAFLATEKHDLHILAENKPPRIHVPDDQFSFYLPSWVPNWANIRHGDKLRMDRSGQWGSASGTSISDASIRDHDVLCVKGICIGTITSIGLPMPDFTDEEFNFTPVLETLHDWWLLFLSAGRRDFLGEKGLVNVLNFGLLYHNLVTTQEDVETFESEIQKHLRVVLSLYMPDDRTLLPSLGGKQEEIIEDGMRLKAETGVWSAAITCRKRKLFLVDGVECGIGPQCAEVGDLAVVVLGCTVPLVLRKRAEEHGGGYFNMGDSYVEGFMEGRAMDYLEEGKRTVEVFELH